MPPWLLAFTLATGDTSAMQMPPRDPWFGPDKVKHGVIAVALEGGTYATLRLGADHREALAGAIVVTASLSLLKELRDRGRTGFSLRDLAWDAAGIAVATLLLSNASQR